MLNSLPASFGGRPSTPTREMAPLNRGFSFNWGRGKDDAKAESGPGQHGQRVESAGSGAWQTGSGAWQSGRCWLRAARVRGSSSPRVGAAVALSTRPGHSATWPPGHPPLAEWPGGRVAEWPAGQHRYPPATRPSHSAVAVAVHELRAWTAQVLVPLALTLTLTLTRYSYLSQWSSYGEGLPHLRTSHWKYFVALVRAHPNPNPDPNPDPNPHPNPNPDPDPNPNPNPSPNPNPNPNPNLNPSP